MSNKTSKVFPIYKPVGISPLDAIKILKSRNPELRKTKMAYAGRLDPMAEGVVLIVSGKELKKFNQYLKCGKKYIAEILIQFSSDTHDILGIPKYSSNIPEDEQIDKALKSFEGKFKFKLPPFSSYKIDGKPLFRWALDDKLDEITIPQKEVLIKKISTEKIFKIQKSELQKKIIGKIENTVGNFRQERIRREWGKLLKKLNQEKFKIIRVEISCSSGGYIRSIAEKLGVLLSSKALLYSLIRTEVGEWTVKNSLSIFD